MAQAKTSLIAGIQVLTQRDPDLAQIIDTLGYPPQWQREPGFATLIQIILEQQVSLASAQATFKRLNNAVDRLTPETFLCLEDDVLKGIGFSRQKITYGRELAQAITKNILDLDSFVRLDNLSIRRKLTRIKGIGDWTVDMYLMMALQRQDIFPTKDLAVKIAVKEIKNLLTLPPPSELEFIAEQWRPYRAIATKILWHYYLNRKSN
ncbi:DNA-3-methyladenine glycosylase [Pleurocapsa sp. PCC 7319]|uniref:DNA-3-methyladenine glycosylase family protein n=1 Tax=Pleurocapsa sp. PCC 7319 TaxID=118161 RepID=UPI00034C7AFE|nr:DNA-3-methyladenine glycosylase [Pleurocapsa sp. PCC 7319]